MRSRFLGFISVFQSLLVIAHLFVYETVIFFWQVSDPRALWALRIALLVLCFSFVPATLLAWRRYDWLSRAFYRLAAIWLVALNFSCLASILAWITFAICMIFGVHASRLDLAAVLSGLTLLPTIYGLVNAAATRVTKVNVKLPNLPEAWRGRVVALVSDTHLGHINGAPFLRRIVRLLNRSKPEAVFISGDLFDGTTGPFEDFAAPWRDLSVRHGAYFITGNHEEFSNRQKYLDAVAKSSVRILNNEKVEIEGLQVVGIHYRETTHPPTFARLLKEAGIASDRASILLAHTPSHLDVAEQAGISLQLSGHTHGGQFVPFTWITSRIYGRYVYGLQSHGDMQVFTTWGAGTWGPPARVGTKPEIVLLTLS